MTKPRCLVVGAAAAGAAAIAWSRYRASGRTASLAGQVVLITGGSRGLGLALAREFGAEGCRLAICSRDEAELRRAEIDLERRGFPVFTHACNIAGQQEVQQLIQAVTAEFGRIDILVNNAGIIEVGAVENFEVSDFERAMDTMFWGTVYASLGVLPQMLERGDGRIVNISSIGGKVSVPHLLPYTSAKFAVAGFSQGLAAEMQSKGIAVTAIYPGLMRTGSHVNALFKGWQTREAEWFTLGATLPGVSMDASRAARQIVLTVKQGRSERTLSMEAKSLAFVNGLFPRLVTGALGLAASALLPKPGAQGPAKTGGSLWNNLHPAVRALSALGLQAMRNYNQKT